MKVLIVIALAIAGLWAGGVAHADRVVGIASIPPAKGAAASPAVAVRPLRTGTVSALRSDGAQIEIDGKWFVVKPGRTLLLRNGLPANAAALAKGQKISFTLASASAGETALGVVHVP
jgi:hypothetical protein